MDEFETKDKVKEHFIDESNKRHKGHKGWSVCWDTTISGLIYAENIM